MKICLFVILFHMRDISGSGEHCIHGGNRYNDGDFFPSNGTSIRTENPQQCVQCKCHDGFVICEIEKCKLLTCETPIQEPEYCCKRCPERTAAVSDESSYVAVPEPAIETSKRNGCTSSGRFYKEGTVWQPVMGPLGVMSCVECRCEKGVIVCRRLRCRNLPCSNPKTEFGKCCPVCPKARSSDESATEKCFPKSSELFVFRSQNAGSNSTKIEYAFLDGQARDGAVHLHVWDEEDEGGSAEAMRTVPQKELQVQNLKLLGATSHKRFKKYSKKAQRLKANCSDGCGRKIFRLEKSLKIYAAVSRSKCNEDEMDIGKFWESSPES